MAKIKVGSTFLDNKVIASEEYVATQIPPTSTTNPNKILKAGATINSATWTDMGLVISASTAKTPADADLIALSDSAATNVLKNVSLTNLKTFLFTSPTLTTTPTAPTATVDTNTTQIATTAFVLAQAGAANPVMDGTVTVGTSLRYSRQDHVHPVDTSRAISTHAHGNISTDGLVSTSATIGTGDRLLITDSSASNIVTGGIAFGIITTTYLNNAGAFTTPPNDNTATAVDDILDGSNTGTAITYTPYTTNQATLPRFYTTVDNPTGTTRINLGAAFHATQLHEGATRVSLTTHTHGQITSAGAVSTNVAIADTDRLLITDASDSNLVKGGVAFGTSTTSYLNNSGAFSTPPNDNTATAVDDILDGSNTGTAITYAPYSTAQATLARFYTGTTDPTGTTRLNIGAAFHATQLHEGATRVSLSTHIHGQISSAGAIGTTTGLMVKTTTSGVLTTLAAGTTGQYLQHDGTWSVPPGATYSAGNGITLTGTEFTVTAGGSLTQVAGGLSHSTADGNLHVPATSTTNNGKVLTAGATAGSLSWQPAASRILYHGDETEVLVTGTTEAARKSFLMLKSSDSGVNITSMSVLLEARVTAGTGTYRIYVNGSLWQSVTTTATTYGFIKIAPAAITLTDNAIHTIELRMLNSGASTTYNRTIEFYVS